MTCLSSRQYMSPKHENQVLNIFIIYDSITSCALKLEIYTDEYNKRESHQDTIVVKRLKKEIEVIIL